MSDAKHLPAGAWALLRRSDLLARRFLAAILLACAPIASAQDVLTAGSGSVPAGASISIPISIRDRSGTPLGTDAGAGNRIQGFAFKILYPTETIATVSFAAET